MKPFAVDLFLSDVDGTLLNAQKELTGATRRAIERLQASGVLVSLISARPPRGLKWLIEALALRAVCAALNGAVIIDPELRVLSKHYLLDALVREIMGLLEEHNLSTWVYTESEWYVPRLDAAHVQREAETVRFSPLLLESLDRVDWPVVKIVGMSDDSEIMKTCERLLSHRFGEHVSISRSLDNRLEITSCDASKGTAIDAIGSFMKVPLNRIATAGDGENDILMFRKSGFSIAMGQAPTDVRRAASQTTTSNAHDGLAWAIENFVLRNHDRQ